MSPSNSISSVISTGSPTQASSPTGQVNANTHPTGRRCLKSLPSIAWLRPISRVIRKKWFLTLILTLSAVYCIISFTPSMNRSNRLRESGNYLYPKSYMSRQVYNGDDHSILDHNLEDTQPEKGNSKLLLDHISSHELLALPEVSKVNSLEEPSSSGQEGLTLADTPSKVSPFVFGSKLKLPSKPGSAPVPSKSDGEPIKRCRNSIQGRLLLADDQGFVCHRQFLTKGGCCNSSLNTSPASLQQSVAHSHPPSASQVTRYSCNTCNSDGCCAIYEYCISCCMNPESFSSRQQQSTYGQMSTSDQVQLSPAPTVTKGDNHETILLESFDDSFEYCLAKCRTSSSSVKHENSYRDPRFKHCHGQSLNVNHGKERKQTLTTNDDHNGSENDLQIVTSGSN